MRYFAKSAQQLKLVASSKSNQHTVSRLWQGLLAAVLVVAYAVYTHQSTPEYRLQQFLASANRRDTVGMLSLAALDEVQRMRLTPQKLAVLMRDAGGQPDNWFLIAPRPTQLNDRQFRYNRIIELTLSRLSREEGSQSAGMADRRTPVFIVAYNTDDGWKIGVGKFIYSLLAVRWRGRGATPQFVRLCTRHGVTPALFVPELGTWKSFSTIQATADSDRR